MLNVVAGPGLTTVTAITLEPSPMNWFCAF
jgi:hypothetical protein